MRVISLTTTAILALTTVSLAQVQTDWLATQSEWREMDDDFLVQAFSLTVDEIEDKDLYDAEGRKIGEVEEVIGLSDGTVIGLAVETDDYVRIDDDDEVVVPIDRVRLENDRLVTDLTMDELMVLPQWDD